MEILQQAKRRKVPPGNAGASMNPIPEEDEEKSPKRPKILEFEAYAPECIIFYLVHTVEDMDSAEGFHPEFSHQHFGEKETIYGYKDLQIAIWLHATTFLAYVDISYSKKVTGRKKADEILPLLKEHFPGGFTVSRTTFIEQLKAGAGVKDLMNALKGKARLIDTWHADGPFLPKEGEGKEEDNVSEATDCEVLYVNLQDDVVRSWHSRMQPVVAFFIENGQLIDNEDPLWDMYVAVERGEEDAPEASQISIAGYSVVYRFYHHPENTRFRVSQVVVYPPYQGKGHGSRLLQAVNTVAVEKNVFDVTVEDPSDELQRIRETVDVLRLLDFAPAVSAAKAVIAGKCEMGDESSMETHTNGSHVDNFQSSGKQEGKVLGHEKEKSQKGGEGGGEVVAGEREESRWGSMPSDLSEKVREVLKINDREFLRCWEILLLIFMKDGPLGEIQRKQWRSLVRRRLYCEELGGKHNQEAAQHKKIVDIDYVHNGMTMFFMTKMKNAKPVNEEDATAEGNGEGEAVKESMSFEERMAKLKEGLRQFCEERISDVELIVQKVQKLRNKMLAQL